MATLACALTLGACGSEDRKIDPTPARLDGSESHEFESQDIGRARSASDEVKEYCSGAVSEAQEVGCLSHLDEGEIP
jgi:hypothetical protein